MVTRGHNETIYPPGGSGGQERNDEFKRVDETQAHDISSLDTVMTSENISQVQRGRVQIAVADFVASWDNYGGVGSQPSRLRDECQERCHRFVRLTRVESRKGEETKGWESPRSSRAVSGMTQSVRTELRNAP